MKEKKYSRKDFLKKIGSVSVGSFGIWLTRPSKFLKIDDFSTNQYHRQDGRLVDIKSKNNYRLFDDNWLFKKQDVPGAEEINFDSSDWRKLDLPHDWSIEDLPSKKELPSLSIADGEWKFKIGDNLTNVSSR